MSKFHWAILTKKKGIIISLHIIEHYSIFQNGLYLFCKLVLKNSLNRQNEHQADNQK